MASTKANAAQSEAHSLGKELREQLKALLNGGQAHATFEDAVRDMPVDLRGAVPPGLPYSAWQLLEHIRIAQRDILEFSRNHHGHYRELKWPEAYWPQEPEPPAPDAWDKSIEQVRFDRKAFERLLDAAGDDDLAKPFPWGNGQNLLREAFLIADHEAYHVGELILVRRLLGAWKS